jgi:hypothetical protein
MTLHEAPNQDPAHQAAVAVTARHFVDSVNATPGALQPGASQEELQTAALGFGEAVVGIASEPELQELLPGLKQLVPNSFTREAVRTEIGEDQYDLALSKTRDFIKANETEESKVVHARWVDQSDKLVDLLFDEKGGDLPEDFVDEEFVAARGAAIETAKKDQIEAMSAMKQDEEVQKAFAGREDDLQKFIDMQTGMVEETEDYFYVFNVASRFIERTHSEAAQQAGESAVANTVEKPQQ